MAEELKRHDIILHNHICGNTTAITEDFIATGAPVLEVDHKTDARKIKAAARHRTCLLGNIDIGLLAFGNPQQVDAACRELLEIWKPDSGCILGPGCALGAHTPAENIPALVEAATKYGEGVKRAYEEALQEFQEMRRRANSSLVIPEAGAGLGGLTGGMGGMPGGSKLQLP